MTTPIVAAPDWNASQASPWLPHNEAIRRIEAGARRFIIADRNLTAPPGSCADGACYLIAGGATGAWAAHDGALALAVGANAVSGWYFLTVAIEGVEIYVQDENIVIRYDGAVWNQVSVASLADIEDVLIISPQTGDVLVYDSDYNLWVNTPADFIGGGGGGGGGGSGDVLIASHTTGVGETVVSFTAIPDTYRELLLVIRAGSTLNSNTSTDTIRMTFNGDTGSNYQYASLGTYPSSNFIVGSNNQSYIDIFGVNSTGAGLNPLINEVRIPKYADSIDPHPVFLKGTAQQINVGFINMDGSGQWENAAAIDQIDLTISANAFSLDSKFELYGIS